MLINFKALEKKGFIVNKVPEGVEIIPAHAKDIGPLLDIIEREYGVGKPYSWVITEDIHEFQVLSALRG